MADDRPAATVEIRRAPDVAAVRRIVGKAMDEVAGNTLRRTRIVTAASEIARNTLVHGGGGRMELHVRRGGPQGTGIVLTFRDEGKGIADIEQALRDGFTTGDGLGMGLGGAKRLCDEFHIASAPGGGTTVRIASWLKRPS
ncbi:MAG: ATP-binding protein [Alphaproteobacteria bacterium]